MPPHLFDSDCESVPSMGRLFNSLLSTSLNMTPMCNDSSIGPMCNDAPMCDESGGRADSPAYERQTSTVEVEGFKPSLAERRGANALSFDIAPATGPTRPPLNPIKPSGRPNGLSTVPPYRSRKRAGLSVDIPSPSSSNPHLIPPPTGEAPPRISCARNVELRRKSLSERHFFRPVSEDEEFFNNVNTSQ